MSLGPASQVLGDIDLEKVLSGLFDIQGSYLLQSELFLHSLRSLSWDTLMKPLIPIYSQMQANMVLELISCKYKLDRSGL
ncbi:hypothetical protein LAZ67_X001952 [Cordylochernes scorpioides]|uniref:Uncharacterized protein n=1 Tax=Cordylochernes scorpioides TaxID=51811 RepID=A0ABY6LU21_9ARAC|nr:hypothetical protein LAZ67_X001952 [Cordylochernes scorpioides]